MCESIAPCSPTESINNVAEISAALHDQSRQDGPTPGTSTDPPDSRDLQSAETRLMPSIVRDHDCHLRGRHVAHRILARNRDDVTSSGPLTIALGRKKDETSIDHA